MGPDRIVRKGMARNLVLALIGLIFMVVWFRRQEEDVVSKVVPVNVFSKHVETGGQDKESDEVDLWRAGEDEKEPSATPGNDEASLKREIIRIGDGFDGSSTKAAIDDDDDSQSYGYDDDEEQHDQNVATIQQTKPKTRLPVVTTISPSKNSNRTLASLAGKCTNTTLAGSHKLNYGIHVIMSFFKGTYRNDRFREILIALRRNLLNPYVTAVHVLWEDYDPIQFVNSTRLVRKLVRVNFGTQPTYKDFFDYANLRLGRGAVGVVLNSDIILDETIGCVTPTDPTKRSYNATKRHVIYALSRHPTHPCISRPNYCVNYSGSHDAFVFALPLPMNFSKRLDFHQNNIAAENVVIWEFKQLEGYVVKNPCYTVKIYHLHCSSERHYARGAISRGRNRIGPVDRHGDAIPTLSVRCGQVVY